MRNQSPIPPPREKSARSKPQIVGPAELPLSFGSQSELWLGLTVFNVPLEALDITDPGPSAVIDVDKNKNILIALNNQAADLGLFSGMALNGALALVPELKVYSRNPRKEEKLLDRVASWGCQFSSFVHLVPPDGLVIEVGRSLRLFGGVDQFQETFEEKFSQFGFSYAFALAPTPMAATWLSRVRNNNVLSASELHSALANLQIAVLRWPRKTQDLLQQMGISTIGACLRLPRDGLVRRLGAEHLRELDQALGKFPDVRAPHQPGRRFISTINFDEESNDRKFLMGVGERLLSELAIKLRAHQQAIDQFSFHFYHLKRALTSIRFRLLAPTHEYDRMNMLFCDRFERFFIEEPVISVKLITGSALDTEISSESLDLGVGEFQASADSGLLVERLRSRFGIEAVYGLCLIDEHRPEAAWHRVEEANTNKPVLDQQQWNRRRPLWMLSDVIPLVIINGQPCYDGALHLEQGPERIETGWWDDCDVCRDYYIAKNPKGAYFWIFQNRQDCQGWYLHGIFS